MSITILNEVYLQSFLDKSNKIEKHAKKRLYEEYHQITCQLSRSAFSYDEPISFDYPFNIKDGMVETYLYYIDFKKRNFQLALLTSQDLGEIEEQKIIWHCFLNEEKKMQEESENVKIIKKKRKMIMLEIFEKYYYFFIYLIADFYLVAKKNIDTCFFSFQESILQEKGKKFFIFLPAKKLADNFEIDFEMIQSFLKFKRDDSKAGKSLIEIIKEHGSDFEKEELKAKIDQTIFTSVYSNRINYYVLDCIPKPKEQKAIDYIKIIQKYYNHKKTLEEVLAMFDLTFEQANKITINQLLYNHEFKDNIDSIHCFRSLDSKYNLKTDYSSPIMLLNYINHINCFDFVNPQNFINMHNSVRKTTMELNSPNVHLLSSQHLICYPFDIKTYNNFCVIPSIFIFFERYFVADEMKKLLRLEAFTNDIIQATSTPCYDINFNFEVLEVVGDSVLKYLASCFLFTKYPHQNEDFLTKTRSTYIKNKFLSKIAFEHYFHFFVKTHKKNINQWRAPFLKNDVYKYNNISHTIAAKNLADTLEAVLGALFIYRYEFTNVLNGLISLEIPITYILMDSLFVMSRTFFLIDDMLFEKINLNISETMNYKDLKECMAIKYKGKKNIRKSKSEVNILSFDEKDYIETVKVKKERKKCGSACNKILNIFNDSRFDHKYDFIRNKRIFKSFSKLEKNILNYQFRDKKLLITAFNMEKNKYDPLFENDYQSLEFLGDALQEIFVIGNAFKMFRENNINLVPEIMQRLKITLLSNSFMARIAVLLGLHKYMLNVNEETQKEINKFVKKIK